MKTHRDSPSAMWQQQPQALAVHFHGDVADAVPGVEPAVDITNSGSIAGSGESQGRRGGEADADRQALVVRR
jgi:hypothetical protein